MHLAIVDTTGIQPYIFGSNRLSENIGASYLVAQATGPWALQCVREAFERHNVSEDLAPAWTRTIEVDGLDAEVLYAGGGNVMLLCRDENRLRDFERRLSKKALEAAPGLQLLTADVACTLDGQPLRDWVNTLFRKLFEKKRTWVPSTPLLGLGVTRACQSTGLPAADLGSDGRASYSAEVLAKRAAADDAHEALRKKLPPAEGFTYPKDFDKLGRSEGAKSYLAVVHADGNGMGSRIRAIGKEYCVQSSDSHEMLRRNRRYINALRNFSDGVREAAIEAQKKAFSRLARAIDHKHGVIRHTAQPNDSAEREGPEREIARIELEPDGDQWCLPLRPLVFGGDDLTFVCDGRLGLALTLEYLKAFEDETKDNKDLSGRITAGAGVATVKTHYPFARAYALAADLASSAKKLRRAARRQDPDWEASCLDWHLALGGLAGDLDLIRRREYRAQRQPDETKRRFLTLRPVALEKPPPLVEGRHPVSPAQRWEAVEEGLKDFQTPRWFTRRNKLKRLRETLRGGPVRVKAFTDAHGSLCDLPTISVGDREALQREGWAGNRCAYFDAVELTDFFIPPRIFDGTNHATETDASE